MKKIFITLAACVLCMAATAQIQDQVRNIREDIDNYRQEISDMLFSLPEALNSDERERIVDDIERKFDYLAKDVSRDIKQISGNTGVHRTVNTEDFYCMETPTTLNVRFGNFMFFSSPVNYEYHDGDVEIRTTPTTQYVRTPDFQYESSPVRSSFRTFQNNGMGSDTTAKAGREVLTVYDTVMVHDHNRIKINVSKNGGRHSRTYCYHHNNDGFSYFYLGVNNFLNADGEIDNPGVDFMKLNGGRSLEVGFYGNIHRWDIAKFLSLDLGVDYRLCHYSFKKTFNLMVDDNDVVSADYVNVPVEKFKRHNLRLQYLTVPLSTEWRIGGCNPLRLRLGVEGSLRIGCREKQVYKIDGDRSVNRTRNDFGTNLFTYAGSVGIGYDDFEVYCRYSPVALFKNSLNPELYPISIGVRFIAFGD